MSFSASSSTVSVELLDDWHVGSGQELPGGADRLVLRDADQLPFIPSKTLIGVWRDAAERLAFGLDDGRENGSWSEWITFLFGALTAPRDVGKVAPLESAFSVRPAHLPEALRCRLRHDDYKRLRESLFFLKPGVRINRRTGRAKDDHLRFEECVRGGLTFAAEAALIDDRFQNDEQRTTALAFLVTSASLIERLGGKRRRGMGRARVTVAGEAIPTLDKAIDELDKSCVAAPKVRQDEDSSETTFLSSNEDAPEWEIVPLCLSLQTPVAIPSEVIGNVVKSLDFVPGTYLLPYVTSALGEDARKWILGGGLRVSAATPEVDGERGLPIPNAFRHPKGQTLPKEGYENALVNEPRLSMKDIRKGYLMEPANGAGIRARWIDLDERTHNAIDDEPQRPTTNVGGVYTYEAIPARTRLRAEIRVRKHLVSGLPCGWKDKLNGQCALGMAKKGDYGRVTVEVLSQSKPLPDPLSANGGLRVWCLSDVLLVGDSLRYEPTPEALAQALSMELDVTLRVGKAFCRTRRIESWHVRWGYPRPSLVAIAGGSCFEFDLEGTLAVERLRRLQLAGIGERRAEGYGDVVFNPSLLKQERVVAVKDPDTGKGEALPPIEQSDSHYDLALKLTRSAWRRQIREDAVVELANPCVREAELGLESKKPSASQLQAIRTLATRLKPSPSENQWVREWLTRLVKNPRRTGAWPPKALAKGDGDSPVGAIAELLLEPDSQKVWDILGADGRHDKHDKNGKELKKKWQILAANADSELKKELWAYAVHAVFDAATRAHVREL